MVWQLTVSPIHVYCQFSLHSAQDLGVRSIGYLLSDSISSTIVCSGKEVVEDLWEVVRSEHKGTFRKLFNESVNYFRPASSGLRFTIQLSDGVLLGTSQRVLWLADTVRVVSASCDSCYHAVSSISQLGDSCVLAYSTVGMVKEFGVNGGVTMGRVEAEIRLEKIFRDRVVPLGFRYVRHQGYQLVPGYQIRESLAYNNNPYVMGLAEKDTTFKELLAVGDSSAVEFVAIRNLDNQHLYRVKGLYQHPDRGFVVLLVQNVNKFQYPNLQKSMLLQLSDSFEILRTLPMPDWVFTSDPSVFQNGNWISITNVESAVEVNLKSWELVHHSADEWRNKLGLSLSEFGFVGVRSSDTTLVFHSPSHLLRINRGVLAHVESNRVSSSRAWFNGSSLFTFSALDQGTQPCTVVVVNLMGQVVATFQQVSEYETFDVSALPTSSYLIRIESKSGVSYSQLAILHN